ncbi:MAG TPA: hypothetical protein VNR38_24015 [Ureibacillus sp.]|uniref:hypothetical protein n=1 Tax=Peribacillus asahii TaxID=228899 RepID=UPI00207A391D|nr:hypothetical protein [Peribacillus asahii]USK58145.1 hypothetical protein LIT37_12760 [Peribacillus asahii]HWL26778.1 hypothetical protein [Ureibacillus sp.]
MQPSERLVEGVKKKFADEVHETNMLDTVERKIIDYFEAIGSSLKDEFDKAKSLNFEIRPHAKSFLEIEIGGTGLEFIRNSDSITVEEILEVGTRYYDEIYISNKTAITQLYPKFSFTTTVLDKYVEHIFEEYLS